MCIHILHITICIDHTRPYKPQYIHIPHITRYICTYAYNVISFTNIHPYTYIHTLHTCIHINMLHTHTYIHFIIDYNTYMYTYTYINIMNTLM